ncbi:MAG: hypothetical protein WCL51_16245 [Bacteroidota bacterium]
MTKKKQHNQPIKQLSPNEYIKTKARSLPIYKCFINSYWLHSALTVILVARQHPNGHFTIGIYRIDTFSRGLFKSYAIFNRDKDSYDRLVECIVPKDCEFGTVVEIDYTLAHNVIYGAEALAKTNGYKPDKAFEISKYILMENDGSVEYIEINFGKNATRERDMKDNDGVDDYLNDF